MIGAKKRNGMKRAPQTTPPHPGRPPAPTPAPDSIYVVADDVDDAPPAIAASESTSSGLRISGRSPSFVRYPAGLPTPTSVPIVSKKSDRKSANTQTIADTTPSFENAWKSKFPKVDQFPQLAMWPQPGNVAVEVPNALWPVAWLTIVATIVVPTMPTSRSPLNRRARSATVRTRPNSAMKIGHVVQWPSVTGVP